MSIGTRGDQANEPLRDKSYLAVLSNSLIERFRKYDGSIDDGRVAVSPYNIPFS